MYTIVLSELLKSTFESKILKKRYVNDVPEEVSMMYPVNTVCGEGSGMGLYG